jgi:uncharacterized protein
MKRLVLAAMLLPAAAFAQSARDSIISVSANRTSVLIPDRMSAWVIIEGTGETPVDATTRLETKLKAVSEAIRGLGSAAMAEKPISFGVSLAQNQGGYPTPPTPTYLSRSVIRLSLYKLDQMGSAFATLLAAGASTIGSPAFESSTMDAARREKIAEVISSARADAEALAAALGGKLGPLVDVSSYGSTPVNFGNNQQIVFDQRYGSGQAMAPAITINTNVTLRFRLVR